MSAQSHRTDYIVLAVLAAALLAIVWALTAGDDAGDSPSQQPPVRTSHSTHGQGVMACYLLYEKLGVSVRRSHSPLLGGQLEKTDVLLILDPIIALGDGEEEHLARWVRDGGVVVCVAEKLDALHGMERKEAQGSPAAAKRRRYRGPLARDVAATDALGDDVLEVARGGAPRGLGSPRRLLGDAAGDRIVERISGSGRVIVLADSSFLCNRRLGRADNAILAANLVAHSLSAARGGRVAFDEYHLGLGWRESGFRLLAGLLFATPAGWSLLCVTAAAVAGLIYKGRRFGVRLELVRRRRRSKLEFVRSAGATCRAAGARSLAFVLLFHWFRRKCAERARLPSSAGPDRIAAALERIGPGSRREYESVLSRSAAVTVHQRMSKRRFTRMLARLAEIERETCDGSSTGQ